MTSMTLDDYDRRLIDIARESLALQRSVYKVLEAQSDRRDLATFRFQFITDSDVRSWGDLLQTGIFAEEPPNVRLGLLLVTLEAEQQSNRIDLRSRCDRYEDSPLLAKIPALGEFVRDDLIAAEAVTQLVVGPG